MTQTPRRIRQDKLVPAELALCRALCEIEELGADTRLTEALNLVQKARELVADCIDGVGGFIALPNPNAVTKPPMDQ